MRIVALLYSRRRQMLGIELARVAVLAVSRTVAMPTALTALDAWFVNR